MGEPGKRLVNELRTVRWGRDMSFFRRIDGPSHWQEADDMEDIM